MDMRGKPVDLVGNKYGKWVVLSKVPKTVNDIGKPQKWLCQCECGNKKRINNTQFNTWLFEVLWVCKV